jgi:hypothetical protein
VRLQLCTGDDAEGGTFGLLRLGPCIAAQGVDDNAAVLVCCH